MKAFNPYNSKGAVLVIVAVTMTALLGLAGLAIDAGMGYGVKAKLNAALDAAAIAAAKASSAGASNARDAAERFFYANYPDGYLGSTPAFDPSKFKLTTTDPLNPGRVTVNVGASAVEPTFFVRVFGFDSLNVRAEAEVIRQDLDMAFVVDNTGSLAPVGPQVIQASQSFIRKFNPQTDRVALVSFAIGAEVDVPIRTDRRGFNQSGPGGVIEAIGNYIFAGNTNFAEGFWQARQQLDSIAQQDRSSLRAIVFFTDGSPNTFSSTFNFVNLPSPNDMFAGSVITGDGNTRPPRGLWSHTQKRVQASPPYNSEACWTCNLADEVPTLPDFYNAHDPADTEFRIVTNFPRRVTNVMNYANVNRAARNLPEAMAAAARQQGIFVFTLGLGANLITPTGPDNELGQNILMRMANDPQMTEIPDLAGDYRPNEPSGLYCFAANETRLEACYDRLASAIMRLSM